MLLNSWHVQVLLRQHKAASRFWLYNKSAICHNLSLQQMATASFWCIIIIIINPKAKTICFSKWTHLFLLDVFLIEKSKKKKKIKESGMTMEGALLVPTAVNLRIQSYFQKKNTKTKTKHIQCLQLFLGSQGFFKVRVGKWMTGLFSKVHLRKHFFFFPSEKAVNNHIYIRYSSYMLLSSQLYLKRWGKKISNLL